MSNIAVCRRNVGHWCLAGGDIAVRKAFKDLINVTRTAYFQVAFISIAVYGQSYELITIGIERDLISCLL